MPPHQTLYEFPFPTCAKIPILPDIQFGRSNRGVWNGEDGTIILKQIFKKMTGGRGLD